MTRRIFYILLTLVFILLLSRLINIEEVGSAIQGVKWSFVILGVFLGFISSFIAILRLKLLFNRVSSLSIKFIWAVGYLASLVSLLLPFYVGGFGAASIFSKKAGISYSKSFGILFVDFFLGVLLTLILGFIGIYYFYQKRLLTLKLVDWNWIVVFGFTLLIAIIALLILKSKYKKIENFFLKMKDSFNILKTILFIKAVFLTVLVAVFGFAASYFFFIAFGIKPPLVDFILASSIFGILGLIPGAFAKIGQYETFAVLTLPYLLSEDPTRVFSVVL